MTETAHAAYLRARAIEALREHGKTKAPTPSRTYLVHDAWQRGETDAERLAELAAVPRETIYADLARYGIEVAEDLHARLARWTEDTSQASAVSGLDSDYLGIAANAYQRVWQRRNGVGHTEIGLTLWASGEASGDCWYHGSWEWTDYDAAGEIAGHDRVEMTNKSSKAHHAIRRAIGTGMGIEQAVNTAVQHHIRTIELNDLPATHRPRWI